MYMLFASFSGLQ